ncbi:hypothetical protein MMC19_006408 [Ptychographa xylographoides]|nr:hypothetical protein [Ptychographa xylographoides]
MVIDEKPKDLFEPISMALPSPPKAKRKRRESQDAVVLPTKCRPVKRRPEYMSHVEVARISGGSEVHSAVSTGSMYCAVPAEAERGICDVRMTELNGAAPTPVAWSMPSTAEHESTVGVTTLPAPSTADASTMTPLQQTIESQFGLEILLKHNELRLIDQELAKCQVALEQLRRCQVIPYPASTSIAGDMQAVRRGTGQSNGLSDRTTEPAPWDVTDGPYTRHYAKWLIPDRVFDPNFPEDKPVRRTSGKGLPERTTRGSKSDKATPALKSRSSRGSTGSRLQALPAGYPEPKEDKGPMIVKRSTDGKMVKLVCLDCRRENFNSAQGFINHCRIAHSRQFVSHDAAALASGEEVEFNEAGGVVSDNIGGSPANVGLVHPLIRAAHVAAGGLTTPIARRRKSHATSNSTTTTSSHVPGFLPPSSSNAIPPANDPFAGMPFVPSSYTPHLSALFAKAGRGGDLNEFVTEAMVKINPDTDVASDEDDDYEMEDTPTNTPAEEGLHPSRSIIGGARLPARATMSPAPLARSSDKGFEKPPTRKPGYLNNLNNVSEIDYASPYNASSAMTVLKPSDSVNTIDLPPSPPLNLSPNATDPNPAPSLVSDDASDYEDPHSESEAPISEHGDDTEDRYLDIEVEDAEVGEPSVDPELTTAAKVRPHPDGRRRSVLRASGDKGPEGRRVSFRSPTKDAKGGRKQR